MLESPLFRARLSERPTAAVNCPRARPMWERRRLEIPPKSAGLVPIPFACDPGGRNDVYSGSLAGKQRSVATNPAVLEARRARETQRRQVDADCGIGPTSRHVARLTSRRPVADRCTWRAGCVARPAGEVQVQGAVREAEEPAGPRLWGGLWRISASVCVGDVPPTLAPWRTAPSVMCHHCRLVGACGGGRIGGLALSSCGGRASGCPYSSHSPSSLRMSLELEGRGAPIEPHARMGRTFVLVIFCVG